MSCPCFAVELHARYLRADEQHQTSGMKADLGGAQSNYLACLSASGPLHNPGYFSRDDLVEMISVE